MQSWKDHHPDWDYTLYDNDYLVSRRFRTQAVITEYFRQGEYAGVADLMRYEILLEHGGFIPEADSICMRPIDELCASPYPFTCYEIDPEVCDDLGMSRKKGLMCPILASPQGHYVLDRLISEIATNTPIKALPRPWKGSGNFRLRKFFHRNPDLAKHLTVHPAHYFVPQHFRGWIYAGPDEPFCKQLWGTTGHVYVENEEQKRDAAHMQEVKENVLAQLEAKLP
ncbi:MAG: glycosyltransferase [Pseudomonadota bacterium]